jgi:hypothetical protein
LQPTALLKFKKGNITNPHQLINEGGFQRIENIIMLDNQLED